MLEEIQKNGGDATEFMNRVKNKEPGVKLMGFGHRVYKNYDPRAAIVKESAHEILNHLGGDELLDLAMKLEEIALADDYFIERKLYPNVDFYTGLIYRAMGFPTDFFTVLFAMGRLPGWIAHYLEQVNDPKAKINRPRQIYTYQQSVSSKRFFSGFNCCWILFSTPPRAPYFRGQRGVRVCLKEFVRG